MGKKDAWLSGKALKKNAHFSDEQPRALTSLVLFYLFFAPLRRHRHTRLMCDDKGVDAQKGKEVEYHRRAHTHKVTVDDEKQTHCSFSSPQSAIKKTKRKTKRVEGENHHLTPLAACYLLLFFVLSTGAYFPNCFSFSFLRDAFSFSLVLLLCWPERDMLFFVHQVRL